MNRRLLTFAVAVFTVICAIAQELVPMHNEKGQFGYGIKGSGTFTIKPQWDDARPFNDQGVAIVRKGQNFGMITRDGNPVDKKNKNYSVIAPYDGTDLFIVAAGGKRIDNPSKIATRADLSPEGFKGSTNYLIQGAKWGLMRKDGTYVLPPIYQELSNIMCDSLIAVKLKNKLGVVSLSGATVVEPRYDVMTPFNNQGIAAVRKARALKWSLVNTHGVTVIPETDNWQFLNQYYSSDSGKYAIDGMPHFMIPDMPQNSKEQRAEEDRLKPLMKNGPTWINSDHPYIFTTRSVKEGKNDLLQAALYSIDGTVLIPYTMGFSIIFCPSEGYSHCYNGEDKHYFVNLDTGEAYPLVKDRGYGLVTNGRSLSYSNDESYFVDPTGKQVSESYDKISSDHESYIVCKNDKYGLISLVGENILEIIYKDIIPVDNNGLFEVQTAEGIAGCVDYMGQTVIPFKFARIYRFVGDYAVASVKKNGKERFGVIDRQGNTVIPIEYEQAVASVDTDGSLCAWVKKDGAYHSCNPVNKSLTPTAYANMSSSSEGTITCDKNGYYGLITEYGEAIPCALASEEEVKDLINFMTECEITNLTPTEARYFSVRLNPDRNGFSLKDKIEEKYWDF